VLDQNILKNFITDNKIEETNNLSYAEKVALNLIAWGKKKGMSIKELKDWYAVISQAPFQEDADKAILEILEMAAKIESES
jgi:benzoyl-CoA reductase/2-hydroxyglutaryl-CoA dehydratase subunit BcrC/BadD/HgdB